jgi:hypothetical protein
MGKESVAECCRTTIRKPNLETTIGMGSHLVLATECHIGPTDDHRALECHGDQPFDSTRSLRHIAGGVKNRRDLGGLMLVTLESGRVGFQTS